jgi:hypothetical protein
MNEYKWTEADILEAKKRAALKEMDWRAAVVAAAEIEETFWERRLADKFPEIEYLTHQHYAALISFKDGEEWCMCKGPIRSGYRGAQVLVWHKGSKGKLRKLADSYDCGDVIPFIKEVRRLKPDEVPHENA